MRLRTVVCLALLLAVSGIGVCAEEDPVPKLVKQLKDGKADARAKAAKELGQLGAEAKAAVPALAEALIKDADAQVRSYTAYALGQIGPDARAGVPALAEALEDKSEDVRPLAADALGRIGVE